MNDHDAGYPQAINLSTDPIYIKEG